MNLFSEKGKKQSEKEEREGSDSFNLFLTYRDAEELVAKYLDKVDNIKKFSEAHSFCYRNILDIKSRKRQTRYPKIVKQILEMMGHTVEQEVCFTLKNEFLLPDKQ